MTACPRSRMVIGIEVPECQRFLFSCHYKIPRDLSLTGFNDLEFSLLMDPPLSTVRQPIVRMGEEALQGQRNQVLRELRNQKCKLYTKVVIPLEPKKR